MSDELSEERIQELVLQGKKNLRTTTLISNWCQHARVKRSEGRGLIEAFYNVPIGHSGVGCQHSRPGGLMCWDLEEAFLNHYLENCKSCSHRAKGVGADMQPAIDRFEEKRSAQRLKKAAREKAEAEALDRRRAERAQVFNTTDPIQLEISELLDEIDAGRDGEAKQKLLHLASLAREAFHGDVAKYFRDTAKTKEGRLQWVAADVFLTVSDDSAARLEVALAACGYGFSDLIGDCLQSSAALIPSDQIERVIGPLAYNAVSSMGPGMSRPAKPGPLLALAEAHPEEIKAALSRLLDKNEEQDVELAACIISSITSRHPELTKPSQRTLLGKLLRRRHLLPHIEDRGMNDGLNRLRKAAKALFEGDPENCDRILKSLGEGGDRTSQNEIAEIFCRVLRSGYDAAALEPTPARRLAFKRLIWMAVETVEEMDYNPATNFFWRADGALVNIAVEEIDALFGAAAMLSQRGKPTEISKSIKRPETHWDALHRQTVSASVDRFQGALIQWVFMVSSYQGPEGVKRVLDLFERTPEKEIQFKANIVAHLSDLITDTETMNLVLPHLYSAMTSSEVLIRAAAATAVGEADYDVRRDFPDLIFEVYLALLGDPYVYVHQSAVRALKTYSFPEHLRGRLKAALFNLVTVYYRQTDKADFLALCLDEFANAFMTNSDIEGDLGKIIVHIISSMPDYSALKAIERMPLSMGRAPEYSRLVAGLLKSDASRNYMEEKLQRALFHTPRAALDECVDLIVNAYRDANPWQLRIPFALLARARAFEQVTLLSRSAMERLPHTTENQADRLFMQTVQLIAEFESSLPKSVTSRVVV